MSRTTTTALLLAAALTTTPAAALASAPTPATASAATTSAASAVPGPTSDVVAGRTPTRFARTVVLERRSGSAWTEVARATTQRSGRYSITVPRIAEAQTVRVTAPAVRRGTKAVRAWSSAPRTVAALPAPSGPLTFRVTAFEQREVVDAEQTDRFCGGIGGRKVSSRVLDGPAAAGQTFAMETDPYDGERSAWVDAPVVASWTSDLVGCQVDDRWEKSPCSTRVVEPLEDWGTSVHVRVAKGSQTAEVVVNPESPSIGYQGSGNSTCWVEEIRAIDQADLATRTLTVPVSTLQQPGPITLTSSGTQAWDEDYLGRPADITQSWTTSITLERVTP